MHEHKHGLRSLLTTAEVGRVDKILSAELMEKAIDRIPRQVRRRAGLFRRALRQVEAAISLVKKKSILPNVKPASNEALDELTLHALSYWRSLGRLNTNRISIRDPVVAFCVALFSFVAKKKVEEHDMRRRLADSLKKLKPAPRRPVRPNLRAERRTRKRRRSSVARELEKLGVSREDAKEIAEDTPVHAGLKARKVARRVMREWEK
jgi:hypothetical protein